MQKEDSRSQTPTHQRHGLIDEDTTRQDENNLISFQFRLPASQALFTRVSVSPVLAELAAKS
jgi:hypothetical protein